VAAIEQRRNSALGASIVEAGWGRGEECGKRGDKSKTKNKIKKN